MNKKVLIVIALSSFFIFAPKVQALVLVPYFDINVDEYSTDSDDTFDFHLVETASPTDPTVEPLEDFSIDTVNGSGSYSTGGFSGDGTKFILTQDPTAGWGSPAITCTSDNAQVTTEPTTNGIIIYGQGFSSADCVVTNTKVSSAKTPVLFIPGVMGTDIFENNNKLWLNLAQNISDIGDQFMDDLQFGSDLLPSKNGLSLGDVVSKVGPSFFVFDYTYGLLQEFQNQGYTQGLASSDNLFLFPYDWRYGVSEDTINKLKQKIIDIRNQTGSDQVDIIAHSTGGLLAKKYAIENPTDNHIDKAIFVGVPNTGAPKALKVLLQGDNFGNPFLADSEMKKIAENLPVVYDLSPSQEYYNQKGSYVKVINQSILSSEIQNLDFAQTNNFLTTEHSLNSQAITNAQNLHTVDFDNFDMRAVGIDLYAIDGCKTGTMGNVIERRQKNIFGQTFITYDQPTEIPGDGTVPFESATNLPIDSSHKYYALKADHGKMPSQDGIRQEIVNLVSGSSLNIDSNKITQDISECKLNGKAISVYSPLSIDVTDQYGNHTGILSDGSIHNDIPNADFQIMGDHKFVYLPKDEGQTYSIKVAGTDDGTFTVKDATITNNNIVGTDVFSNIPVTTSLTGTLNIESSPTLSLDTNGDGSIDSDLSPSSTLSSEQSQDFTPPTTTTDIEGDTGQDAFYRSSVSISLTATDPTQVDQAEASGTLSTSYNLDEAGYQPYYNSPIVINTEGAHTFKFFSTDKAGNNEQEQLMNFTIDKTAPEITIQFDPTSKDLQFIGHDNISDETDVTTISDNNIITVTDQADNTTVLQLKGLDRKHGTLSGIKSLSYNGQTANTGKALLSFIWKQDKNGVINELNQHVVNRKNFNIDALYSHSNTKLTGKDQTGKIKETIDGLVALKVSTNQGDLNWSY